MLVSFIFRLYFRNPKPAATKALLYNVHIMYMLVSFIVQLYFRNPKPAATKALLYNVHIMYNVYAC